MKTKTQDVARTPVYIYQEPSGTYWFDEYYDPSAGPEGYEPDGTGDYDGKWSDKRRGCICFSGSGIYRLDNDGTCKWLRERKMSSGTISVDSAGEDASSN